MFFLNSDDVNSVPDSLFFLHKIGLLKHKSTDGVATESLYFYKNNKAEILWTENTFANQISAVPQTILVFDFLSAENLKQLKGHNLIVVPHVYFDYIATIKDIADSDLIKSYKIFSPRTRDTTLIPKKHLMKTLPFLTDSNFANQAVELESSHSNEQIADLQRTPIRSAIHSILNIIADVLLFFLKPITTTKLFYSKYNLLFLYGKARVGIIKLFYSIYNFRFKFRHTIFEVRQLRFAIMENFGKFRVGNIKVMYRIINLRFFFQRWYNNIRLTLKFWIFTVFNFLLRLWYYLNRFFWFNFAYTLYPIRKLIWIVNHEFNKRVIARFSHATKN